MWHYKWIAKEIDRLDPEVDYERIVALSNIYYANDFVMNLYYTIIFPCDIVPPHVAEAVAHTKKVAERGQQRADDTFAHFWKWFEYGPNHLTTQRSVAMVNRIHLAVAKQVPGKFSHNEDFVYTLCNMACELHRLQLRVGLPGLGEKEKVATARFFAELSNYFEHEGGGVTEFPPDFDAIVKYCEDHEARPWPSTQTGHDVCEDLIAQFAERWFPKPVRRFAHPLVVTLLHDTPRRVHRLKPPSPRTETLIKLAFRTYQNFQQNVFPDPQVSAPERSRRRAALKASRSRHQNGDSHASTAPTPTPFPGPDKSASTLTSVPTIKATA